MAEPRQISGALARVVGGLSGPGGDRDIVAVLGCWDAVVGEHVATHARPRRLRDGVLVVEVDEPGWATQLRYLRSTMTAEINEHLGDDAVDSIEVRVARR